MDNYLNSVDNYLNPVDNSVDNYLNSVDNFFSKNNSPNACTRVMYCLKTLIIITNAPLHRGLLPRELCSQGGNYDLLLS